MRKLTTLLLSLLVVTFAFGKSVTMEKASQVANNYFAQYSGKSLLAIESSFSKSYDGITTYYVFNYVGGGFVVVSADDAAIPVLAQSNQGFIENEITNPAVKFMFDSYSKEIAFAVSSALDNSATIGEWNSILNNNFFADAATLDVTPLLTTIWDQGQWYNFYCPTAAGGPGGKAWAGCVATTMGQVMKYFNFPAKGVLSHSYVHPTYGNQTANFGVTNYNFSNMGNAANSGSYTEIATLLRHAGVAVDMNYAPDGSGAFSQDVPWAMATYFNYDQATIRFAEKSAYTNTTWVALLKAELDASRPMYFSGSGSGGGHAWVCDGYRNSDTKFHMNWGWSGSSNGYYTATSTISAGGYTFNATTFAVVCGIKPGNPDLIVRFTDLPESSLVSFGSQLDINCSVVEGTPTGVKLYIDDQLVFTTTQTTFTFPWATASAGLGAHTLKVEAINATDTVFHKVTVNLSEWITQASGFTAASRGISYVHAVDSLVVWATAYDGSASPGATINEFTRTTNGGNTWTPGQVLGGSLYGLGNICGIDGNTAFVSLYHKATQDNTCGVYKTVNGGTTWTHSLGALQGSTSFANNVWFWNANEGMCHGDVKDNYFEIYTTSNGGTTWTRVPKANIGAGANPASGEGGWTSVIDAVGDSTIMFGTNKAKLYISYDRGHNWTISNTGITPVTDGINKISFKNKMNGIVAQTTTTVVVKETHDGGATWQTVTPTGPFFTNDMTFVPGTDNTFVTTGAASGATGASYSFDGAHTWAQGLGTEADQFLAVDFVNNHCGWAGGFSADASTGGMFKYIGLMQPFTVLSPVTNLVAQPIDNTVGLTWSNPATLPLSYNIYRNDTLIGNSSTAFYTDSPVANGQQNYCVTALYDLGESLKTCTTAWITVGVPNSDEAAYRVYPNPANEIINVVAPVKFDEIRIINTIGKLVYRNSNKGTNLKILTQGFDPGMYILQIYSGTQVISKKISITR